MVQECMYNPHTYRFLRFSTCSWCAKYCAKLSIPANSLNAHRRPCFTSTCSWVMKWGTWTSIGYLWPAFVWQAKLQNADFSQEDKLGCRGSWGCWMASESKNSGQFHLAKDHKFQINFSGDFFKPCLEPSYLYPLQNINKIRQSLLSWGIFHTLQLLKIQVVSLVHHL